jgi:hypothetical protein
MVTVCLSVIGGFWVQNAPHTGGDSPGLVAGSQVVRDCIHYGNFRECGVPEDGSKALTTPYPTFTAVGPYPLLQYVPATALLALGANPFQVLRALSLLSIVAFFAMVATLWLVASRVGDRAWGPALVLASISGPLLYYGFSTLGEMMAAYLLVATVALAAVGSRGWPLAIAALFAGITKETAPPFVLAMGAIAVMVARPPGERRAWFLWLTAGAVSAALANAAFNVFRYGVVKNRDYLQSGFHVHDISQRFGFFGDLLVGPNGGILLFWATAIVLLFGVVALGLAARDREWSWWPAAAIGAVFVVLLAGLASWWSPYGWYTWGPRLTIPWIPALSLLAVLAYGRAARPLLKRFTGSHRAIVATALAVTVLTMPHIGVLFKPDAVTNIFGADDVCPASSTPDTAIYYRCVNHQIWGRHMVLLSAFEGDNTPPGVLFSVVVFSASVGLLVLIRESLYAEVP